MRFNQDKTAFCCAFQDGARVFNLEPIRERAHYTEDQVKVQGCRRCRKAALHKRLEVQRCRK